LFGLFSLNDVLLLAIVLDYEVVDAGCELLLHFGFGLQTSEVTEEINVISDVLIASLFE